MNGTQFMFAVTFFSVTFVAICLYFDKHRHKDPYFRKKLKLKREKERLLREQQDKEKVRIKLHPEVENTTDYEAVILHEIQLAEGLMIAHQYERAIVHFANAISICVDPCNLLIALRKTLPSQAFDLLIEVLVSNYAEEFSKILADNRLKPVLESYHSLSLTSEVAM